MKDEGHSLDSDFLDGVKSMTYICPIALFNVADMDFNVFWYVKSSRSKK
jgi:hypothetical protein